MLALIPVFLSIGAIYALIPVIVIVILIAAAAGLRTGSMDGIFGMFGFAAIASYVGGKGAIGAGKAGKGIAGAKYKSDTKTLRTAAGKMGATAKEAADKKQEKLRSATAESILKEQKGPGVDELAASWKRHDYQRDPGMARMAVAQEVIKRYRRGIRGEDLMEKNLSVAQRITGRAASVIGTGVELLYRHGLTTDAAVAIGKKLYPDMQAHTRELKSIRNELYKNDKGNKRLAEVFGAGRAYAATSKFDNWSERIVGRRIISTMITPEKPTGPVVAVGTETDVVEAATLWSAYIKMVKNEARKATTFEWESRARPPPAPPPPPGV